MEECTRLEIKRDSISRSGHSTTIDDRIASSRGFAYSLMETGLHGEKGVKPIVLLFCLSSICFTSSYYGLDMLKLSKSAFLKS